MPARALYNKLLEIVLDIYSEMRLVESEGAQRLLAFSESNGIRTLATEFEAVLKAELSGWDTFFVSQKGGFSTADLISNAEKIVPECARQFLTQESLDDIRSCGQCLAFNLGTAAAFHVVRAAEAFIVRYYESIVGSRPPVKARNWGAYVRKLEKCGKADSRVLGWIKQIKDEYRNPVLHPEETVAPEDALEFVNACTSLMAAISRALIRSAV